MGGGGGGGGGGKTETGRVASPDSVPYHLNDADTYMFVFRH